MALVFVDRYRAAGLSGNPFAVEALTRNDTETFVDRGLATPPPPASATLVQVIGDKGVGKTTHVMEWRRRAPGPYHYVPRAPSRDRWRTPPVAPLVYADEIDRMPRPVRYRWFRQLGEIGATIVAGTHNDLSAPARRAGLSVVSHQLGPVDLATLAVVVDRRFRDAGLSVDHGAIMISERELSDVHERSCGNLRAAERLLHQLVATRVSTYEPRSLLS